MEALCQRSPARLGITIQHEQSGCSGSSLAEGASLGPASGPVSSTSSLSVPAPSASAVLSAPGQAKKDASKAAKGDEDDYTHGFGLKVGRTREEEEGGGGVRNGKDLEL